MSESVLKVLTTIYYRTNGRIKMLPDDLLNETTHRYCAFSTAKNVMAADQAHIVALILMANLDSYESREVNLTIARQNQIAHSHAHQFVA